MSQVDSTAVDGRGQSFRGAGCDPAAELTWLQRLHRRSVDRIPDASARRMLQNRWLRPTDAAGWPTWEVRGADTLRLPDGVLSAYRTALRSTLEEACGALRGADPPPPDGELAVIWQQALASFELPSTRMLLSQQAQLVAIDGLTARVRVIPDWLAMAQSRVTLIEQGLAYAIGHKVAVVLETGEVR